MTELSLQSLVEASAHLKPNWKGGGGEGAECEFGGDPMKR